MQYDIFYELDLNRVFHYYPPELDLMGRKWKDFSSYVLNRHIYLIPPKSPGYVWSVPAPWEEMRSCSDCKEDGARREPVSICGGSVDLMGGDELGCFLPALDYVIISNEFLELLRHTPFQGYSAVPLELACNASDCSVLDSKSVYCLLFHGNINDLDRRKKISQHPEMRCPHCQWGPIICPGCLGIAFQCPKCKSIIELYQFPPSLNIYHPYENTQYRKESYFDPSDTFETSRSKYAILQAKYWNGSDFIGGFPTDIFYVTGRVARWLVENQYGPVFLIPVPTDTSACSPEQLKKIEQIRYYQQ